MTGQPAYTDADVQAALAAFWARVGYNDHQATLRGVLDAVAPAIAARALREFADSRVSAQTAGRMAEDLRDRADEIEAP